TQAHNYSFTDAGIGSRHAGTVYYRLQQVDTDGTTADSPVRAISFGESTARVELYPNPATDQTTLDLTTLAAGDYQVTVVDAAGRTLSSATYAGGASYKLSTQNLSTGLYLLVVRGQGVSILKRLERK
ncbi:T9SS type A sorting domain-containing protein, partial [Hymenobacter algoricola]|uniref:T9SS type A sorting domain-containing protein n=1 Tax=Hymenobacter algoricola TaxID=486267 RepID=UPI0031EF1411